MPLKGPLLVSYRYFERSPNIWSANTWNELKKCYYITPEIWCTCSCAIHSAIHLTFTFQKWSIKQPCIWSLQEREEKISGRWYQWLTTICHTCFRHQVANQNSLHTTDKTDYPHLSWWSESETTTTASYPLLVQINHVHYTNTIKVGVNENTPISHKTYSTAKTSGQKDKKSDREELRSD